MCSNGYYSLDSILSDETPTRVIIKDSLKPVIQDDVNSYRNMPLWLAASLVDKELVEIKPKCLTKRTLDQIGCAPNAVNIRSKCPVFYFIGKSYAKLTKDEGLCKTLKLAFSDRFGTIFRESMSNHSSDASEYMNTLTNAEQEIFREGVRSITRYLAWKKRKLAKTHSDLSKRKTIKVY